jgi:hypothetical protein
MAGSASDLQAGPDGLRFGRCPARRALAAVVWRRGLAMKPMPAATGAMMTTRSYWCARSALAIVGMSRSMQWRSRVVTGGQAPGTAQLAHTASTRPGIPGGIKHGELAGPRVHRGHPEGAGGGRPGQGQAQDREGLP